MKTCASCGFLALRNSYGGKFEEALALYREKRQPRLNQSHLPNCFAMAFNLPDEVNTLAPDAEEYAIEQVLRTDRTNCPEWTQWQQGFSPKEHQEMLNRQVEQKLNNSFLERLEEMRARRENKGLILGVVVTGVLLILATLGAPVWAVWVQHYFFGG